MAISGGDGSIILTTKVDESGITKSTTSIKAQFAKVGSYLKTIGTSIQTTFSKVGAGIKNTFSKIGNWLKNFATSIAAQFATIFGLYALINFSKQSAEFATQTEASVQRLVDIYGEAAESVGDFIDANARAIGMSRASASSFASVYGNLFSVWADQNTNAELTNRYLNMTAVVASKTGRTVQDVQERVRSGLLGNTEAIEDLGVFVNVKTIEMTDAFQRMADGKSWEQLDAYTQQQVRTMAILEQATAKYGNTVADTTATTRAQYQAAYEDFQNTWGQVVNTILIPVLKILTQVFTIATKGLQVMAGLSGKTVENSGETSSNIKQQTKEQEKLNKAVKKGLASFDEINTLTEQSAENTADAGTGTQFSGVGETGDISGKSAEKEVSKMLEHIMRIVGASLVAIGVLLIMAKKVGWGIGFIIAGASTFGVSAASSISGAKDLGVKAVLSTIMGIVGDALLAVGVVLLFKGQIQWGIGFIISGAAAMAVEYFATTEFSTDPVENTLIKIMGILGTVLAVVGILLCIFGGPAALPWGIGFIIAGAVAFVSAVAINSDAIVEAIRGPIGAITAIVGAALLVLGIILTCTGNLILGIPLIVAGAVSLVTPIAINANAIVNWIKDVWNKVKQFWNSYIAPVFTLKWWIDLAKTCGNGLIAGFELAVNSIIWLFEGMINFVVGGLNLFLKGVDSVISAVGNVFGQDWSVATIPEASLGRVSIPRLAQGAVIPPNREFMAILGDQKHGTNIEAPLDTIKQAVAEVMSQTEFGGGFGGRIEVPVIVDGREIARAVREAEGNMGSQTVFGGFANVY